jgi:hypothetical protein
MQSVVGSTSEGFSPPPPPIHRSCGFEKRKNQLLYNKNTATCRTDDEKKKKIRKKVFFELRRIFSSVFISSADFWREQQVIGSRATIVLVCHKVER